MNLLAQNCDVQLCAPWAESSWASAKLHKLVVGPPDTGIRWPSYTPGGDPWLRTSGTTTKTRYITNNRLVARVDDDHDSGPAMPPAVIVGPKPAAVVLTDYGRGAITAGAVNEWASFCRRFNIPMYGDPKKGRAELWSCRDTELAAMVLNWEEAEEFADWSADMSDTASALSMGALILKSSPEYGRVIVKRGIYGSMLYRNGGSLIDVIQPVLPRDHVADRQGAGDTYLAAMIAAAARGVEMPLACRLASAAAGVAVSRPGTSVVSLDDALDACKPYLPADITVTQLKAMGYEIGYTNGCFDFHLHPGHLSTLRYAASLCDFLFVGVDSDSRVKKLKGDGRPVVSAEDRVAQLEAVKGVYKAFVFDDHEEALRSVRCDVLVKGEDWKEKGVPEAEMLKEWGGRLEFAPAVSAPHVTDRLRAMGID